MQFFARQFCLFLMWGVLVTTSSAAEKSPKMSSGGTNQSARFTVKSYEIKGDRLLSDSAQSSLFAKYTGTNISLSEIVKAASDLLLEYHKLGNSTASVAIAQERITNGVVTLNIFRGRFSEVIVSGRQCWGSNGFSAEFAGNLVTTTSNTSSAKTNSGPHFAVRAYEIRGDTLLSDETLIAVLTKYTGTNIGIAEITKAAADLQMEYRDRGFPTVNVAIPQQQLTNGIVKFRIFQGRLSDIVVTGNRYFSSNNVMRALPGLQTNMILNGPIFQSELDRANANQDRQIYPQLQPGAEPNTTELVLKVKDRLPLHAKTDFNNQSSPGTPELRLNSSAVYNNLWQLEHAIGLQYSFSPFDYKSGTQWNLYDQPLVANYSGFYRLPLGSPESVYEVMATGPENFGFDEATRKFRLPPPSHATELNVYASRSTIDTRLATVLSKNLYNTNGNSLDRRDLQQDITVNNDLGFRLSWPLKTTADFQSGLSAGLDFKTYEITSVKTNIFGLSSFVIDYMSDPRHPQTNINLSTVYSPVPTTHRELSYLPVSWRYDASLRDGLGITAFGLGVTFNPWHSGSSNKVQSITGSTESSGYWVAFTPSFSRDIFIHTNWVLSLKADGQWATQPLISNEQFGLGGVNSVRGYREGEVFGDTGWRVSAEQRTPPHIIGWAGGKPVTVRGSIYMDYGETYLLDPMGRKASTALWGAGFGGVADFGSHFEARLLFSWPLLETFTTERGQPRFDVSLTAQF